MAKEKYLDDCGGIKPLPILKQKDVKKTKAAKKSVNKTTKKKK